MERNRSDHRQNASGFEAVGGDPYAATLAVLEHLTEWPLRGLFGRVE